jgi:hypothetical protein
MVILSVARGDSEECHQANVWTRLHDTCVHVVRSNIIPDSTIAFDSFVQIVVLRSILVGLLDVGKDADQFDFSTLTLAVAGSINFELWMISKSGATPPPHLSAQLHD